MLREVATIVNQESDFTIIAEKVLELIDGLLEPLRCTIFLQEGEKGRLQPLAQCRNRKVYSGTKVQAPDVSGFDLSAFERHSIVCRVQGRELQAIVPLKVEDKTLGVLWLAFPTDARPPEAQTAEFNRTRRTVLLEITQHISLAVKTKHLQTKAVVDGLTGLYSRSHFDAQLQATVELAQRTGEVFSLLLADIDHFKAINDTYGHATGDVVLSRVAMRIQRALRKYDTAYRYGGEEIAILLPRTRVGHAAATAERLRSLVESQRFRATDGRLVKVTMSIGVAQFKPADGPQSLLERADRRLYQAKYGGRNRVVPAAA
jgi:diguanylate cyclase (GGDEF)-like protein